MDFKGKGATSYAGGKSRPGGFFSSHPPFPSRVLGFELVIGERRPARNW